MNSRELVLGRIRDAITLAPARESEIPRNYRTGRTMSADARMDLFVDRLEDYKAHVHRCTATEIAEVVTSILTAQGLRTLGIPAGLDRSWVAGFDGTLVVDGPDVPAPELENLDAVVTGSKVSCAETGTIFLDAGPSQGRRALTLVPDTHICVVYRSSVEVGVPEAIAKLTPERPTTMISGPSATSDIELERVEGVHGPRNLHVVIVED
ncbi:lactate utilization protein B/C [Rhodococcus sp. KBW08]|uniref:LutC/YkgG family protein n=1 Tax=unclassified Rhodococcus (in: high G+C Gram-positive bacteria) TaxID=192944 RepID=UPI000F5B6EBD|nr:MULTISPECIES: LUD domain-containing protein [unclassified Rhodococcus (in: high G+C Gram-positive bacteria)]QQM24106.1 LUD domain-containing protein [Rhodococcus sp. P-2]RQO43406.1 lactate utilization protein B/C [Rhodococcus sp. KBW08]